MTPGLANIKILLDHHLSHKIGSGLWAITGIEVIGCLERGLAMREDWELMNWCIEHGYTMCTRNGRHFRREHIRVVDAGGHHPGILVVGTWDTRTTFLALWQYLSHPPDASSLVNYFGDVPPPTQEFRNEKADLTFDFD